MFILEKIDGKVTIGALSRKCNVNRRHTARWGAIGGKIIKNGLPSYFCDCYLLDWNLLGLFQTEITKIMTNPFGHRLETSANAQKRRPPFCLNSFLAYDTATNIKQWLEKRLLIMEKHLKRLSKIMVVTHTFDTSRIRVCILTTYTHGHDASISASMFKWKILCLRMIE